MARRSRTNLDDWALLPWWINVILAAVACLVLKYLILSISFQNPLLKGIPKALPSLAPIFGGILFFGAEISAFNAWRKDDIITETTGSAGGASYAGS